MRMRQADRHIPSEDYLHDASEIARWGRNAMLFLGSLAMIDRSLTLISDAVNGLPAGGDLLYTGETGLGLGAGAAVFHVLHKTLASRLTSTEGGYLNEPGQQR